MGVRLRGRTHVRLALGRIPGPAVALAVGLALPLAAEAQTPSERAADARSALEAGRVAEAVELLAALTSELPEDAGLHWLYARALLAARDTEGALREYRTAAALSPADPWLRLELGRTSVASGAWQEIGSVLGPVARMSELPSAAAEAETILGLAAYWDGDLTGAQAHLTRALELDPSRAEAAASLIEVRGALAPVLTATTVVSDDDQPVGHLGQELSFRAPISGRVRGVIRVGGSRRRSGGVSDPTLDAQGGVEATLPGGRLRVGALAGVSGRGSGVGSHPTGAGRVTMSIDPQTSVGVSLERWQYRWTLASLDTAVAVSTLGLRLDRRAAPRWAGEVAFTRDAFPDDNAVRSLSAWVLAPAIVRPGGGLRVGYAVSYQDSEQNTFTASTADTLSGPPGPRPGRPPGRPPVGAVETSGLYTPYYTPENLQTHSLIVEARGGHSDQTSVRATLVYAAWARELAPTVEIDPEDDAPSVVFGRRSFTPWDLRAQMTSPIGDRASLLLSLSHGRTAFYRSTRFEAVLTYRFLPERTR